MLLEIVAIIVALIVFLKYIVPQKIEKENVFNNIAIPGMPASDPEEGNNEETKKVGMCLFLQKLHREYGPIASFWEGKQMAVSIASPELFKDVRNLYAIPNHAFEQFVVLTGPDAFTFQDVDEIKRRRKIYEQHFMLRACKSYAECFVEVAENAAKKWRQLGPKEAIPLTETLSFYSIAAMARTSFGDYFKNEDNITNYYNLISYVFKHLDPPPEPDVFKEIKDRCDKSIEIVRTILNERTKLKEAGQIAEDDRQLLIDVLLGDEFTDNERIADSAFFIGAGYFTTAIMMAWTIYELALNPTIQEKVHQEIVDELGAEHVSLETIPKLKYLRQVIDEVLRLYFQHIFTARMADENTKIGGYKIPEGTTLYLAMGIVFMDPKIFPNPEKFDPDRFTPENLRGRHAYAYKPFGFAGKRVCPGMAFANTEMIMFIAQWLRNFRFKLVPGQNVQLAKNILGTPEEEIMVYIEPRH